MSSFVIAALLLLGGDDPVGWRGDGSGRYPAATPPTSWGRVSRPLLGLRFQAAPPKDDDRGTPMPDGVIREWLLLHPAPAGVKVDKEVLPGEAGLAPAENDRLGDGVWKKVRFDTAWMNFKGLVGERGIACAATYVHSETGGPFRLNVTTIGALQIVLNGKAVPTAYGRYSVELAKGWNRILLKVAPGEWTWSCTFVLHARAPADFEETNLAWAVPLPGAHGGFYGGGTGCGSLIVVGERLYLLSEPHDLICLDKASGRILWVRSNSVFDATSDEDRKKPDFADAAALAAKLDEVNARFAAGPLSGKELEEKARLEGALSAKMQELDPVRFKKYETPDVGFSGYTPICDGTSIYLWLGSGVTASYDLDGRRRWIRQDNIPAIEHGFSSSPLLVDGKIVVFMRDVLAFDAASGALAWRLPLIKHEGANPANYFHGTPARAVVDGVPLIVLGNGTILRASDGKILFTHPSMGTQAIPSPVVEGRRVLLLNTHGMTLFIHTLPASAAEPFKLETRTVSVATTGQPYYYMPWHMASPLVVDGLAYLLNNSGVLTVVDLDAAQVLYQKMLDLDHFQNANDGAARGIGISPALGGKHVYLFGNNGAALVLEPGREFRPPAKNKIESIASVGHWGERQERFVSNPVFDGPRLYLRGEGRLYAVEAGGKRTSTTSAAKAPAPAPAPAKAVVADARDPEPVASPVFGWRRDGTGAFPAVDPPTAWDEKTNVLWTSKVGAGQASPVVAGDRVFAVAEPGVLLCLSRLDGRLLWKAEVGTPGKEPPGTKERARLTPVTDGASVFVALGDGRTASYTLEGKQNWLRVVEPPTLVYGPSASPLLAGDKLLLDVERLTALDAATGRPLWKAAAGEPHYGSPALLQLDGTWLAVTALGTVVRVADGAVLGTSIAPGAGGDQSPTPLVRGGIVYFAYRKCSAVKLALADGKLRAQTLWQRELPGDVVASPVLKDGLLHVVAAGGAEYRVLDAATGDVLLEKALDLFPQIYPSLALAGGKLYVGNDGGDTLVLAPGREYRQLGKNSLPDGSGASPVFAGSRLFLRGGEMLYCVGR